MEFLTDIKDKLAGQKFYLLMAFGVIVSAVQFLSGVDFGVPAMPVAGDLGEFAQQIYLFLVGGAGRAAVSKV